MSKLPPPLECTEHVAVIQYLAWKYPKAKVFHAPMEGKRGWQAQRVLKSHGAVKGFPDIIAFDWRAPRCLFIEMKRVTGGNVSKEQRAWLQWLQECGHTAILAKGYGAAVQAIEKFFTESNP